MAATHVISEIQRFLASEEPEVLCITGKWGVGKTYSWNHYLRSGQEAGAIKLGTYSYVSLFGKNSLDDLKRSIFEEAESTKPRETDKLTNARGLAERFGRKAAPKIPHLIKALKLGEWGAVAAPFFFLTVRNQIVCIDDLERAGRGLDAKDVLGLATFLKEQRNCKVALLLNDQELTKSDKKTYASQLEKVADTVLIFDPTAKESAAIGVSKQTPHADLLARHCETLGIVNIRVIKRIERIARRLQEVLTDFDKAVFEQALHSATLFTWARFQPDAAPPIGLLKDRRRFHGLRSQKDSGVDPDANWRAELQAYGYTDTDDFDLVLLDSIERGYFDEARIRQAAGVLQEQKRAAAVENSFQAAWDRFHGSFADDQEEVLDALYESFKRSVDLISPTNFSGTVEALREMGRQEQAEELIQFYMDRRTADREFFDLDAYAFNRDVRDAAVVEAFKRKYASFPDTRDPEDILKEIGARNGWNKDDISKLSALKVEDFYAIFKASSGNDLRRIVKAALTFRTVTNPTPDMLQIVSTATEALQRIGRESPLNARRVQNYGVDVTVKSAKGQTRGARSPKQERARRAGT